MHRWRSVKTCGIHSGSLWDTEDRRPGSCSKAGQLPSRGCSPGGPERGAVGRRRKRRGRGVVGEPSCLLPCLHLHLFFFPQEADLLIGACWRKLSLSNYRPSSACHHVLSGQHVLTRTPGTTALCRSARLGSGRQRRQVFSPLSWEAAQLGTGKDTGAAAKAAGARFSPAAKGLQPDRSASHHYTQL